MNALESLPVILQIYGNHDGALAAIARQRAKIALNTYFPPSGTYFDGRVYIEHGHQADRHNAEGTKRGKIIVKVLTYLGKRFFVKKLWPNFMRWMELLERFLFFLESIVTRKDEWRAYKQEAVINRVKSVFRECEQKRAELGLGPFSKKDPLIYIRGHDHGDGFFFTINELIKKIYDDPQLAGRVRYCSSGSWKGDDADVLAVDYSQTARVYVYPFNWKTAYERFAVFQDQVNE